MDKLDIEELVVSYKAFPDEAHAEEVIKAMEPLIKYWCRSQCYIPREKEDMLQVARIAVFDALRRFEPDKGIRFKTYAYRTVSGKLMNYYRDNVWQVSVPRKYRELAPLINKAESEFLQKNGREAKADDLRDFLNADEEFLKETKAAQNAMQAVPLFSGNDDEADLSNILGNEDQNLLDFESREDLKKAMADLDEIERKIIYYRYFAEWTQKKVGEELNLTQMQVSRAERRGIGKIESNSEYFRIKSKMRISEKKIGTL